jgi:ribosomal protein S18 acetylase RimI-like enzyme
MTSLYRTWDAFEVTTAFNLDPELALVAETPEGKLVGFALGTTYQREKGAWKYGYVGWLGVHPEYQRKGIATQLYRELERRMRDEGCRMVMLDTVASNYRALEFFRRAGFGHPETRVWMHKSLAKRRRRKAASD